MYNELKANQQVKPAATLSLEQPPLTSHFMATKKYNSTDHRQIHMRKVLVAFVASDLMLLPVVDSPKFQRLLEVADSRYQIPSCKHLSRALVPQRSLELKEKIVKSLEKPDVVCTAIDLWTNRQMRSYFGMTVHYISDWSLHSAMLACSRFRESDTGFAIADEFEFSLPLK